VSRAFTPAGPRTVRRHNAQLVLAALAGGTASRAVLAQRTGLTKSTVSSLVEEFIEQGVLLDRDALPDGPGRPSRPVSLNPDGMLAVGIEINVDYVAVGLLDLTAQLSEFRQVSLDIRGLGAAEIVDVAATLAAELTADSPRRLLGAGIAVAGVVDTDGVVLRAPNMSQLNDYPLQRAIRQRLGGIAVKVENEANCGALARLRTGPAAQDFAYVSGEIGVGAAIVLDGSLFRGVSGFAGELGHVVIDHNGPSCGCGGNGCVEQYAGLQVMLRNCGESDARSLVAAVAAGKPAALAAVRQAGSALGVGLSSLLNVLDLPLVFLGGLYAELFDVLAPPLRAQLDRRVLSNGVQVRRAGSGADDAIRGAASMIIDRALSDPETLLRAIA
jgi:predicted NBD/HSP70 family sugar kinase